MQRARAALDRFQQRLNRARPGSVLIIVIALLLLMAIIGMVKAQMSKST